ncbi:hypothetical protein BDZ89DRAFT_1056061, partial [Hymenopellis radicata]
PVADTPTSSDIIELVPYGEVTFPFLLLVLALCIFVVVMRKGSGSREETMYDMREQHIALKPVSTIAEGAPSSGGVVMVPVLFVPQGEDDARSDNGC